MLSLALVKHIDNFERYGDTRLPMNALKYHTTTTSAYNISDFYLFIYKCEILGIVLYIDTISIDGNVVFDENYR